MSLGIIACKNCRKIEHKKYESVVTVKGVELGIYSCGESKWGRVAEMESVKSAEDSRQST